MFNYVREFIPNMSSLTANMRLLLKNDVDFQWNDSHTSEFETLKKIIASAPVLATFDPSKPIVIQTDASQFGLGCCLLQDKHPVAFASRSLSQNELNYGVTEKELLAAVFAVFKFHNFIYGYLITIQTDHLPLVALMMKKLHQLGSSVLQRLRLKLLKY